MRGDAAMRVTMCVLLFLTGAAVAEADDKHATTDEGEKRVVLHDNGTWEYTRSTSSKRHVGSPDAAVRAYLSAQHWRERLPLVLERSEVEPLMMAHYRRWRGGPTDFELLGNPVTREVQGRKVTKVKVRVANDIFSYYVVKTSDGYKIDWKHSVGYNAVSPEVFRATKPIDLVRMHVYGQLDDYYNFEFDRPWIRKAYWSIQIKSSDKRSVGHGYIKKDSKAGQALFKALTDGAPHKLTVSLKYHANAESSSVFVIDGVHSIDDWAYSSRVGGKLQPHN